VIVHSPKIGESTIAEPSGETVKNIENICNSLMNPKKVIPLFQCQVMGAMKGDFINSILKEMKNKSFSQFPVVDENGYVTELITNNTICRWVEANIESEGTLVVENVKVETLLHEIEYNNNYKFVSRDCTVIDVYDLFTNTIEEKEHNLDAVFITQNGKKNEKLLGIICIEDIAHEIKAL
jgi:predicted transcriptional regulator